MAQAIDHLRSANRRVEALTAWTAPGIVRAFRPLPGLEVVLVRNVEDGSPSRLKAGSSRDAIPFARWLRFCVRRSQAPGSWWPWPWPWPMTLIVFGRGELPNRLHPWRLGALQAHRIIGRIDESWPRSSRLLSRTRWWRKLHWRSPSSPLLFTPHPASSRMTQSRPGHQPIAGVHLQREAMADLSKSRKRLRHRRLAASETRTSGHVGPRMMRVDPEPQRLPMRADASCRPASLSRHAYSVSFDSGQSLPDSSSNPQYGPTP